MNKSSIEKMKSEALIAAFEQAAISYGEAHDTRLPERANEEHDKVEAIYKEIQKREPSTTNLFVLLLMAQNPWVRYAAAAYAIDFIPEKAQPVLAQLANAPKALGMMAFTTLRNWEMKKEQIVH